MRYAPFVLAGILMLPGCSLYRMEIQQGNMIEPAQLEKLKVGMDKGQVRFLLGTPLITDPFHENRWDYVYSRRRESGDQEYQRVTVYFENETVSRVDHTLELPAPASP